MSLSFASILQFHRERYPAMQPQDFGKLAYQSEFGPEHLVSDRTAVQQALFREWETLAPDVCAPAPDPLGNGLSRFHLDYRLGTASTVPLLADLVLRTADAHHGSADGLARRLDALSPLPIPGMAGWVAAYRAQGCPPPRHSEAFRAAYRPHYRLLRTSYAGYFPALLSVQRLTQSGRPAIVAVDGRCGSGKTGFARLLQELFPCRVVHMDDFYLPFDQRPPDWAEQPAGNMDLSRFREEVLVPLRAGGSAIYRPYSCQTGQMLAPETLAPAPLTIVEGSYSLHPSLSGFYDLRLFLTCSGEAQARRLQAREGAHYAAFQERWIPFEERYFQRYRVASGSDMMLDTSAFFL